MHTHLPCRLHSHSVVPLSWLLPHLAGCDTRCMGAAFVELQGWGSKGVAKLPLAFSQRGASRLCLLVSIGASMTAPQGLEKLSLSELPDAEAAPSLGTPPNHAKSHTAATETKRWFGQSQSTSCAVAGRALSKPCQPQAGSVIPPAAETPCVFVLSGGLPSPPPRPTPLVGGPLWVWRWTPVWRGMVQCGVM